MFSTAHDCLTPKGFEHFWPWSWKWGGWGTAAALDTLAGITVLALGVVSLKCGSFGWTPTLQWSLIGVGAGYLFISFCVASAAARLARDLKYSKRSYIVIAQTDNVPTSSRSNHPNWNQGELRPWIPYRNEIFPPWLGERCFFLKKIGHKTRS